METSVKLSYLISEDEWARSIEMRWEQDVFPTYDCFYGEVSFRVGDQEVLGAGQFNMSIVDLAVGFAELVGELRSGAVSTFNFNQSDDALEISFQADRESVNISHNVLPNAAWTCGRASLENALVEFIVTFTEEAARRVPDFFSWRDLEILKLFKTRTLAES